MDLQILDVYAELPAGVWRQRHRDRSPASNVE